MKYLLTILVVTLFFVSCGVPGRFSPGAGDSPGGGDTPGGGSTSEYMSFALTNRSGTVAPTTPLARASRYGLSVKRENGAPLQTADYTFSVSPADAIRVDVRRSNSIDFTIDNTSATSVTIIATHKDNSVITKTLELKLASPANFMSFAVSNIDGALLTTTTPLTHGDRYMVSITPTSASPLQTANYDIVFSPESAITRLAINNNSISFRVNDGTTALKITATHKDNPVITKTLDLSFVRNFMSFTLTNRSGTVDTTTPLSRTSSYGLSVKRESGAPLQTADYTFSISPTDAIRVDVRRSNSIDFTLNNTSATSVLIIASHKDNSVITKTLELKLAPPANFMSFAVSNIGGQLLTTTTPLIYRSNYVVTITPTSVSPLPTANYDITFSPASAITGTATNTNSISFTVKDGATALTIIATHKNNTVISKTLNLNFIPRADFMSFTLTNRSGALVDTTTALDRAIRYGLNVKRESGAPLLTTDYTFSVSPADAITVDVRRSNSIDFTVNNTSATRVTITAIHKTENSIIETLVLDLAPQAEDFMSFALNDNVGTPINTTSFLNYGNTYILTTTPASGIAVRTANYDFSFSPANAITINTSTANTMTFTVNNADATGVTITATHKDNPVITETLTLNLRNPDTAGLTPFANDIQGNTVPNLDGANALTREVLEPLGANAGATLVKRYATEAGAGNRDGSSWANAWAATNLRNGINSIADASASKVYLVMIAGGIYKPVYGTSPSREISFSMKNRVAIMGGFKAGGGWERTGTTSFSGDIGTVDNNTDNSYHVFNNVGLTLGNSHLYGVIITNGNANGPFAEGMGGGIYNNFSSPNLTQVVFSGNSARSGGGMYNVNSSPVLNNTVFSGNSADVGGGMHNYWSTPVLVGVAFSGNTAILNGGGIYSGGGNLVLSNTVFSGNSANEDGGGMFIELLSYPVINNTVFSGNIATDNGGGMYIEESSPVLVGAVFSGNSANNGGGMYNNHNGKVGPRILNTIFSGNTTNNGNGAGPDIAMDFGGTGTENITIAGSVLGTYLTTGQPTNAIVGFNGSGAINISNHNSSLSRNAVNLTDTATFTVNGMDFTYPTITAGSSAINLGLFVRKSGSGRTATYYFSEDNTTWYSDFLTTGGWGSSGTPPANAEDMSATDITGKARTGRPDAGVNEL